MNWKPAKKPGEYVEPKRLAEALGEFTHRLGLARPDALTVIFGRWEDVVGPSLAAHVRPIGLRDGVLFVEVDETGWATQLRYLGDDVIRRVNEHIVSTRSTGPNSGTPSRDSGQKTPPTDTVTSLNVRVAGPARGRRLRSPEGP
jgi:predicted nucleic acid-binding Zn ribbon protein